MRTAMQIGPWTLHFKEGSGWRVRASGDRYVASFIAPSRVPNLIVVGDPGESKDRVSGLFVRASGELWHTLLSVQAGYRGVEILTLGTAQSLNSIDLLARFTDLIDHVEVVEQTDPTPTPGYFVFPRPAEYEDLGNRTEVEVRAFSAVDLERLVTIVRSLAPEAGIFGGNDGGIFGA